MLAQSPRVPEKCDRGCASSGQIYTFGRLAMQTVAVIGGGFAGMMTAYHLLELGDDQLEVILFEPSEMLGGVAYTTTDPYHLLNVPAGKMSALPDRPDDFLRWLNDSTDRETESDDFVPRAWFGEYLRDRLNSAAERSRARFRCMRRPVTKLAPGWVVSLDGDTVPADAVVLAVGYSAGSILDALGLEKPFQPDSWPIIAEQIGVVGTGLTGIDAALAARRRYPTATIRMVSGSSSLPEIHGDGHLGGQVLELPKSLRELTRWIRQQSTLMDWQDLFEAIRPEWNRIWDGLSPREQRQFLRHLDRILNRYRHRVPAISAARINDDPNITIEQGRVIGYQTGHSVTVRKLGGRVESIPVDFAIDASGPSFRYSNSVIPLLESLRQDLGVPAGPHGMGLPTDKQGVVHGIRGLYAVGPIRRGAEWETTAVREIRVQAADVARQIMANRNSR